VCATVVADVSLVAVSDRQLVELLKDRHEARDQHKRQSRRAKYQEMVSYLAFYQLWVAILR
jgi:hypothetical protein